MGHNNPGRARREIARDNEKMTDEQRRQEGDAEALHSAKALAVNDAFRSFSNEERAIYTKVKDALAAAESRAFHAWHWDKEHGGTGKKNPWRKEQ
jgi:hypothetical protein